MGPEGGHSIDGISSLVGFLASALITLLFFLFKEIRSGDKAKVHELAGALKDHAEVTQKNTTAVQLLTLKVDLIDKRLERLGELEKDHAGLGEKLRGQESQMNFLRKEVNRISSFVEVEDRETDGNG